MVDGQRFANLWPSTDRTHPTLRLKHLIVSLQVDAEHVLQGGILLESRVVPAMLDRLRSVALLTVGRQPMLALRVSVKLGEGLHRAALIAVLGIIHKKILPHLLGVEWPTTTSLRQP